MAPYASLLMPTPQPLILLVCVPDTAIQHMEVDRLLDTIRSVLNTAVQIMRISATTHPEVVHSFGVSSFPAFVLVQRGLELWRYSGPVDTPELVAQLNTQMQSPVFTTH